MTLQPGARLGSYEIVSLLGAGGMGQVYLAREWSLGRSVALKVLPPEFAHDAHRIARFELEARSASALSHPNICTIFALGELPDSRHFIAMEYIDGQTLRQQLAADRPSLGEALDISSQIAAGVSAAHALGIVHRDLKPENVLIRPDGLVKVVDFGLAKLARDGPLVDDGTTHLGARTDPGCAVGTIAYMSPEQARAQDVDVRTDIWSLGVLLFEMIAGRSPFAGTSSSDVLAAILEHDPPPLARFCPDAPAELQRIITKALRKDRTQRFQTMQDLLLDVRALRDGAPARSASAPSTQIQYAQTTDGVSIAFCTHGEGPPLVMMPSFPFSHIQLEWDIPECRAWFERLALGRTVICYDPRGSGLSDRDLPSYSVATLARDLAAVVDRLGLDRFSLFAPIDLSATGIAYAAENPARVSHLVTWCGYSRGSDLESAPETQSWLSLMDKDWHVVTHGWAHAMVGWTDGDLAGRLAEVWRESCAPASLPAFWNATLDFDVVELLPKVQARTLVLHRRGVRVVTVDAARRLAAKIVDARLTLLEGSAGMPFAGDTDAVAAALEGFLAG